MNTVNKQKNTGILRMKQSLSSAPHWYIWASAELYYSITFIELLYSWFTAFPLCVHSWGSIVTAGCSDAQELDDPHGILSIFTIPISSSKQSGIYSRTVFFSHYCIRSIKTVTYFF